VGAFPDGQSALNLAAARLRHIAGSEWSKRYLSMEFLKEQPFDPDVAKNLSEYKETIVPVGRRACPRRILIEVLGLDAGLDQRIVLQVRQSLRLLPNGTAATSCTGVQAAIPRKSRVFGLLCEGYRMTALHDHRRRTKAVNRRSPGKEPASVPTRA
jgi:hypothetical protein